VKVIVNVRISDMARISAAFGLFYVLQRKFEMPHYFNDVKVLKNSQDQCEFECLFIINILRFLYFLKIILICIRFTVAQKFEMGGGGVTYRSKFFFNILSQQLCFICLKIDINFLKIFFFVIFQFYTRI
jgi:hypothetical protein